MNINETEVLKSFISRSEGGRPVNVFDVIYDTGVRYPELAPCLKMLEENGEIESIDDETYLFKGDRTRQLDPPPSARETVRNSSLEPLNTASQTQDEEPAETYSALYGDYDDEDDGEDEDDEDDEEEEERPKDIDCRANYSALLQRVLASKQQPAQAPPPAPVDGDGIGEAAARRARDNAYRIQALKLCVEQGQASVSFIQRNFPVGYIESCKIVDWMESMGYVSAAMGSRPRRVLLTMEQFKSVYGDPPY